MLRWALFIALCCGGVACAPLPESCGNAIECAIGPRIPAKLSSDIVGKTKAEAIALAGLPTSTYTGADGLQILTWRQEKTPPNFNMITCTEKVTLQNGVATAYERNGSCSVPK